MPCCVDRDGSIDYVREDVGRRNALDGRSARWRVRAARRRAGDHQRAKQDGAKAAALGFGTLAAVSTPAPGRKSRRLIGFLRQEACVVYTGTMAEHAV